jgi:hypothetical protein
MTEYMIQGWIKFEISDVVSEKYDIIEINRFEKNKINIAKIYKPHQYI